MTTAIFIAILATPVPAAVPLALALIILGMMMNKPRHHG